MNQFNPFSVAGKVVVVTGASSGIGQSIAVELSKLNVIVVGIGRNKERLIETKEMMVNTDAHLFINADLTQEEDLQEIRNKVSEKYEKIHGVVHCAGISSTILLKSINTSKIQSHFEINVFAALSLTKVLLNRKDKLFDSGSSIVFISSVMENHGATGKTLYGMTKGAILSGVKSLSIELASKGIRVNAIAPSVIDTPLSQASYYRSNPETLAKVQKMHPLGLGKPTDVAYAAVYLLSEASSWVTGTSLVVDGGYSAL